MRNYYSLSMRMEEQFQPKGLFSFSLLIPLFVMWSFFGVQAQSLKTKNAFNEISSSKSNSLTKGLVKISGYEKGFETEKYLDPEFYDLNGKPTATLSRLFMRVKAKARDSYFK